MSLKEFTAYQPVCDIEGCGFVIIGDVEFWHQTPEEAANLWREYEGWTDGEDVWICEKHLHWPHAFVGTADDWCDRCHHERDEHEDAAEVAS